MNWNDILIRVHVRSEPPNVPVVEVVAKAGEVDVLGLACVKDEVLVEAWKRFRARATKWDPDTPPYDWLRFDLFGLSNIADIAAQGHPGATLTIYAQSGGRPVVEEQLPDG